MTLLAVIGLSLPILCPFHAFAFPSVSLFRRGCNLEWINNFCSDFPLNSGSAEWLYFDPPRLGRSARARLRFKAKLWVRICDGVSYVAVSERCPDYGIPAWVDCPRALPSRPKSQANDTFRGDLFNGRNVRTLSLGQSSGALIPLGFHLISAWQSGKPFVMNHHNLVPGRANARKGSAPSRYIKRTFVPFVLTLAMTERSRICCKAEDP